MTTDALINSLSGRDAAMARRKALSMGKAGLPAANERVRSGFREAALPAGHRATEVAPAATPAAPVAESAAAAPVPAAPAAGKPLSGREASMARRRQLVSGKASLVALATAGTDDQSASVATDLPQLAPDASCRDVARQRRSMMSRFGRGDNPAAGPSRPPRQGEISYPEKVPAAEARHSTVTGLSFATGRAVTGAEAGRDKPLTGTQYVGPGEGGFRAGGTGKVGLARTPGGLTVSGTMVRSKTQITGDESSGRNRITGEADQTLDDDLSPREEAFTAVSAQFQRQSQPHGQTVFGSNLGRSAKSVGSRSRDVSEVVEATEGGNAVSGTAVGRSSRVTGDFRGACQSLTGTQYLAPARAMADCGGRANEVSENRADPVTLGKVTESRTWSGQKVTGPQFEHSANVSGGEAGNCSILTGTPYFGATSAYGWCEAEQADGEAALRGPQVSRAVTGDVPLHDPARVSGTGRGAEREIGGTPYFIQDEAVGEAQDGGGQIRQAIGGFSVNSPQRSAHLATISGDEGPGERGITGTFAQGEGKVTGNVEFAHRNRGGAAAGTPGHARLTGEGATGGPAITGSAWSENSLVTGTEGYIAAGRNSSVRSGEVHGFAGARRFQGSASQAEQKSAVTGAVGWTPKSGAAVTLSGGAAG